MTQPQTAPNHEFEPSDGDLDIYMPHHDKHTKCTGTQRRLRSDLADPPSGQSDQSSLCAKWTARDPRYIHADGEDSDQTGRMLRLI